MYLELKLPSLTKDITQEVDGTPETYHHAGNRTNVDDFRQSTISLIYHDMNKPIIADSPNPIGYNMYIYILRINIWPEK